MNELKVFTNEKFGSVRTVERDNDIWFVGKDVAEALGYGDGNKKSKALANAIADHVDNDDKILLPYSEFKGYQNGDLKNISHYGATIINESGLYALIFGSKLESAKEFKHWVTSEVLPSIRKTGGYLQGQNEMSDSELMAKALMVAQRQIEERNKQIEEMTPKALFAEAVSSSKTSILVGELAKLITQNGYPIGQNRLFGWLRKNGYLMQTGSSRNLPKQRYVEQGLFEIKETTVLNADGSNRLTKTTKVTGKGQVYFVNKFLRKEN